MDWQKIYFIVVVAVIIIIIIIIIINIIITIVVIVIVFTIIIIIIVIIVFVVMPWGKYIWNTSTLMVSSFWARSMRIRMQINLPYHWVSPPPLSCSLKIQGNLDRLKSPSTRVCVGLVWIDATRMEMMHL